MESLKIKSFKQNGYILERKLFAPACLESLIREMHSVFKIRMGELGLDFNGTQNDMLAEEDLYHFFTLHREEYIACMKVIQNLVSSFCMATEPRMINLVKQLGIRFPAFSTKPIIMISSPKTATSEAYWKTPAHQDWRSIQGSLNGLVVWIALADVTADIGPLECIPGSHLWGLLPTVKDSWYRHIEDPRVTEVAFEAVPMIAGDALFFSSFLIHRSGTNTGKTPRYSLQCRFNDIADLSFVRRNFPSTYTSDVPGVDFIENSDFPSVDDVNNIYKCE